MTQTLTDQKFRIEEAVKTALIALTAEYKLDAVPTPSIVWDLKGSSCLGQAIGPNKIRLHVEALEKGGVEWYLHTALHEACHIAQVSLYRQLWRAGQVQSGDKRFSAHGSVWKSMMRTLNLSPDRTRRLPAGLNLTPARTVARYTVECSCMTHLLTPQRVKNLSRYQCRKCGSGLRIVEVPK